MNLGVQYYRAPFPERRYWRRDFSKIRESGLDTVQLWVVWAWVEPQPGRFVFDDYDELVGLAAEKGLKVVLSTIAEIHPYWIHREIPDSAMVDHMGRTVISSNRQECHQGLTPGGCTDHPEVWRRMRVFLEQVAGRYASCKHLHGWDAWNELRWNVNADGLVCFCPHTLGAFRRWLEARFGGLSGLNRAWKRRYACWDDVLPGKLPSRTYTEMMAFQHFLTWRANEHAWARGAAIRAVDPRHPVTVHGGHPTPLYCGSLDLSRGIADHALNRGNDWFFAEKLDGIGCSSFPKWFSISDTDFGMRVEFVRSAARGKRVWLSEIQGGRAAIGNRIFDPVDALTQQRWVWNGLACGADTLLFWCWRDEVFGKESDGFGLSGDDGLAGERLSALRETAAVLERNRLLFRNYKPITPKVGVFFSPQSYYREWASDGNAERSYHALRGYMRALTRNSIPYTVVEEEHLDQVDGLRILFMPRTLVVDDVTARALSRFVKAGGTLVCESECGAFDSAGLYRYPADRFTARLTGIREVGRRHTKEEPFEADLGGVRMTLPGWQWVTPWETTRGVAWAPTADGSLLSSVPVGRGRVVLCGTYFGEAHSHRRAEGFEMLVQALVNQAGCQPDVTAETPQSDDETSVYLKYGQSGGKRLVFVFFPAGDTPVTLRFRKGWFKTRKVKSLLGGQLLALADDTDGSTCVQMAPPRQRIAVLVSA